MAYYIIMTSDSLNKIACAFFLTPTSISHLCMLKCLINFNHSILMTLKVPQIVKFVLNLILLFNGKYD